MQQLREGGTRRKRYEQTERRRRWRRQKKGTGKKGSGQEWRFQGRTSGRTEKLGIPRIRISGTESVFERASVHEVEKARDAVVVAETKLASEGETVRQAEARLLVLCQKANCVHESPPATIPANFMQELARLRALVQELQQERDELRSEFADQGQSAREDGRRKKSSKSLATPSLDFAQLQLNQTVTRGARGRNLSSTTMIDRAEAAHETFVSLRDARNEYFGARFGEASHPRLQSLRRLRRHARVGDNRAASMSGRREPFGHACYTTNSIRANLGSQPSSMRGSGSVPDDGCF